MTGRVQTKKGMLYLIINTKDQEGNRKKKWISTGLPEKGNKREAERRLTLILAEGEPSSFVEPSKLMFSDFIADWLEMRKASIELITYTTYKRIIDEIVPYFKERKIALHNLSAKHIQDYCTFKSKKPNVGPNTVIKHLAQIKSSLQYAKKTRLIKENPTDWVEKPKKRKFVGDYYNRDEIIALLDVIKGSSIEAPLMFAIYFGLRRSEILGIKWSAVDLTNNTLSIAHKIVPVTEDGVYRLEASDSLKTKSSYRTMPLNKSFVDFLVKQKAKQEANKKLLGNGYCYDDEEYICVNDMGQLIKPDYVSSTFSKLLKKNNMRHIRLHDLRHSCASLLLSLGYSLKEIQVYLGHSDIGTTMNIYAHVETSAKRGLLNGITDALSSSENG